MIYALIKLGKKSSDFFTESVYIQSFAHEEIIGKIDEYQNISHIDTALQTLMEGLDMYVNYLQQGVGSRSASTVSYQYDFNTSNASSNGDRKKSDMSSGDGGSLNKSKINNDPNNKLPSRR